MSQQKIIGISAGRKGKITEEAVKTVLEESGLATEFFSLSDFELLTCDACNGCIETYRCVKDDELNQILIKMEQAEGIVFGAPEYWEGINAKGRSFWERICFSTRHNAHFSLQDKVGVAIGVSGDGNSTAVIEDIKRFFVDARLEIVGEVEVQGEYACFTCGYGQRCAVGGLAEIYDLPLEITPDKIPDLCNQNPHQARRNSVVAELRGVGLRVAQKIKDN
ncbi:flavodoxin family protein [Natroniella sulfidigena]|uniref:flavodoxin family protein n=1 Tax=Natroniella sulfidigena TaxID=723921 RepID=UPI00200B14BE|nr:flavodoxin family protein [Natroniella sulfidigena]MCK8817521.1 flavodoxin family protein [Natroniella sulfidigena]